MKTETNTSVTVLLKDGRNAIRSYEKTFDRVPVVGDSLRLEDGSPELASYQATALVSRILVGEQHQLTVEADLVSITPDAERPVVILNANRVPERARERVADYLRDTLGTPLLDWVESDEPTLLLKFHPADEASPSEGDVDEGLRELLAKEAA